MNRRSFLIVVAGGAMGTPCVGWTQGEAMPVIGFLNSGSPAAFEKFVTAFREGLNGAGYIEGQNLSVEYRWANGEYDRLPALANELARRQVALIAATGGIVSARAAGSATSTIPILFLSGYDPVKIGLVNSFNRPGRNATGVSLYSTELVAKRLSLLRELVPKVSTIALLLNSNSSLVNDIEKNDVEAAVRAAGGRVVTLGVGADNKFETAFASAVQQRAGALLVSADPYFTSRRGELTRLAGKYALPAAYPWREFTEAGGLMSYGPSIADSYRQIGRYAGRVLKGANPADMPVQMPMIFELMFNLRTARKLGITVPPVLLATASGVVE
jgi:putative ABC transport system substrate-binding protein